VAAAKGPTTLNGALSQINPPQYLWQVKASSRKQRVQLARVVQGFQIVTSTDVGIAYKNLRHRATLGNFHHFHALFGVGIHPNFLNFRHTFAFQ
jgi:hypothetical protein